MKNRIITLLLLTLFVAVGCSKPEPYIAKPAPVDDDPKTFIFYGNIGNSVFTANVNAAGRAVASGALIEGQRIIVCHEKLGSQSAIVQNVIYELVRDKKVKEGFRRDTLKVYEGENVKLTLNPDDMKELLAEMRELAPANHYGISLGCHGVGWVPKTANLSALRRSAADPLSELWEPRENPKTRYLGHYVKNINNVVIQDYTVDIADFAAALGTMKWDFVLMDVCLMGSVEALYEMRGVADYMIVSPAEVLIQGFPYQNIVSSLFNDWTNLESICDIYVGYYRSQNSEATISLIKNSELKNLAEIAREIYFDGTNTVDPVSLKIQSFEGFTNHVFYDFEHYMRYLSKNPVLYRGLLDQLEKTVVYSDHTDYFYTDLGYNKGRKKIDYYSGLTAYIPTTGNSTLYEAYKQTAWYKAVAGNGE